MPTLGGVVRTKGDHVSEVPGFQADSTQPLPPRASVPRDLLTRREARGRGHLFGRTLPSAAISTHALPFHGALQVEV